MEELLVRGAFGQTFRHCKTLTGVTSRLHSDPSISVFNQYREVYNSLVQFKSRSAAIAATAIVGGWVVSASIIGARFGFHSTAGIWTAFIGMPGVAVASWIRGWTEPSTLASVVAYAALVATNWLFWLGVATCIVAIRRRLRG